MSSCCLHQSQSKILTAAFANSKCHKLAKMFEVLDQKVAELNSTLPTHGRLASIHRFKSGQVPILLATGVGERGLDIPTVDLVILYDIPRLHVYAFFCKILYEQIIEYYGLCLILMTAGIRLHMFIGWDVLQGQVEGGLWSAWFLG